MYDVEAYLWRPTRGVQQGGIVFCIAGENTYVRVYIDRFASSKGISVV